MALANTTPVSRRSAHARVSAQGQEQLLRPGAHTHCSQTSAEEPPGAASALDSLLEVLVQAKLECALSGVAHQGGEPAADDARHPLLSGHSSEALHNAAILLGVHLDVALHDIQGSDGGVRPSTSNGATNSASTARAKHTVRAQPSATPASLAGGGE